MMCLPKARRTDAHSPHHGLSRLGYANPFIFRDMPDEAVVAIDQFLEAFYNHFQNHYFAQMHRWYYELHEREHSHDPVPWRPLDDPPF